jgi:hypothetical protein
LKVAQLPKTAPVKLAELPKTAPVNEAAPDLETLEPFG